MGEIADEHVERMLDRGFSPGSWGFRRDAPVICAICGSAEVHWRDFGGAMKLADDQRQQPGNRYVHHLCATSADGFGDCDA